MENERPEWTSGRKNRDRQGTRSGVVGSTVGPRLPELPPPRPLTSAERSAQRLLRRQSQLAAFALCLRIYTVLCGFTACISGCSVIPFAPRLSSADHVDNSGVELSSLIAIATLEVAGGILVIITEFHVRCLATYMGCLATYAGKCFYLLLLGGVIATLGRDKFAVGHGGDIAPLVVGCMLGLAGLLQLLCLLPCCRSKRGASLPEDPLHAEFRQATALVRAHKLEHFRQNVAGVKRGAPDGRAPAGAPVPSAAAPKKHRKRRDAEAVIDLENAENENPFYGNMHLASEEKE